MCSQTTSTMENNEMNWVPMIDDDYVPYDGISNKTYGEAIESCVFDRSTGVLTWDLERLQWTNGASIDLPYPRNEVLKDFVSLPHQSFSYYNKDEQQRALNNNAAQSECIYCNDGSCHIRIHTLANTRTIDRASLTFEEPPADD